MTTENRRIWSKELRDGAVGTAFGLDFPISLSSPEYVDPRVCAFHGVEALGELYEFRVLLSVAAIGAAPPLTTLLGVRVTLTLPQPGEPRFVHGIVSQAELLDHTKTRLIYAIAVAPAMWILGKTKNSRVYQDMTVQEIASEVLTRHGIPHAFRLRGTYPKRENCLQYRESDLAFVLRLIAEEGYVLAFEHGRSTVVVDASGVERPAERAVIGDHQAMYAPISGIPALRYRPEARAALIGTSEDVHDFTVGARIEPNLETLRDFEFELASSIGGQANPSVTDTVERTVVLGGAKTTVRRAPQAPEVELLEVYDHDVEEPLRRGTPELAKVRLEQLRRGAEHYVGASFVRRLTPGRTFTLGDHAEHDSTEDIVVTRVEHRGHDLGPTNSAYENGFEGVPASVLFRPPAPPQRLVQVVESAIVVGPQGQEIETDGYGRVRVQFHWDRRGQNDDASSCWLRVMQAWSGPSYGFQFVPRVGTEVLVSFLGGNPDHPVIIGCMPSTHDRLPHLLPENKTRSAIRTRTTPAVTGGYNEIQFDDNAGQELFALRAERDLEERVLNDKRVTVNRQDELVVGASRSADVGTTDTLVVGSHADRTVRGSAFDRIAGSSVSTVGANRTEVVAENHSLSIGASSTVHIAGPSTIVVGEDAETECLQSVFGEHRLSGSKLLELRSATKIRLTVGSTLLELTPEGIHIEADKIDTFVKGTSTTNADTVRVATKTRVELESQQQVLVTSKGASVFLEDDAAMDGANVLLNCGGRVGTDPDNPAPRETGPVTFKIEPPPGMVGPFTALIADPDGKIIEKETDANDEVHVVGEVGEKFTLVEVRKGTTVLNKLQKA